MHRHVRQHLCCTTRALAATTTMLHAVKCIELGPRDSCSCPCFLPAIVPYFTSSLTTRPLFWTALPTFAAAQHLARHALCSAHAHSRPQRDQHGRVRRNVTRLRQFSVTLCLTANWVLGSHRPGAAANPSQPLPHRAVLRLLLLLIHRLVTATGKASPPRPAPYGCVQERRKQQRRHERSWAFFT